MGRAFVLEKSLPEVKKVLISEEESKAEYGRFLDAVERSRGQMYRLIEQARESMGEKNAAILSAQLHILDDPTLLMSMKQKITEKLLNAEWALNETLDEIVVLFESIEDELLRERAVDVRDICSRILRELQGQKEQSLSCAEGACIVIARDLTPSDTASMDFDKVLGFCTETGGKTSHTAIMARSMGIPAVVGIAGLKDAVTNGDFVIVDAEEGVVMVNPDAGVINDYSERKKRLEDQLDELLLSNCSKGRTSDGVEVEICVNIGNVRDCEKAQKYSPDGVGLFRTEFLYMEKSGLPGEEEQFEAYRDVAEAMGGRTVIIRTLDVGGDKELKSVQIPFETNPFLGYRAIRICLKERELFKVQLRSILRASAFGSVAVMFPMIISMEELLAAREMLSECKSELEAGNIPFDREIKVGMMIETPASVMMADELADEADFFSIGTNDLTQYVLAVDRGNENIASLYNSFHPAVIRCIKRVSEAARSKGKRAGMCGEFAANAKAVPLLIGLGLNELSVSASSVPKLKSIVKKLDSAECIKLADSVLKMKTCAEIEAALEAYSKDISG